MTLYLTSPTSDAAHLKWYATEEEAKEAAWQFLKQGWQVKIVEAKLS